MDTKIKLHKATYYGHQYYTKTKEQFLNELLLGHPDIVNDVDGPMFYVSWDETNKEEAVFVYSRITKKYMYMGELHNTLRHFMENSRVYQKTQPWKEKYSGTKRTLAKNA